MKARALLVSAFLLASGQASAQQVDESARSAARALAEDGVSALQSGNVDGAVDKLERAYQIVHLPTVGIWSARALAKQGHLVAAAERYVDVTRWTGASDPKQDQAKADAAKEREEILPKIASATISVDGAPQNEVTVTLDGKPLLAVLVGTSIPVDPMHHVVKGTHGTEVVEQPFDIGEGQKLPVTLHFGAAASAPPPAAAPAAAPPPAAEAAPASGSDVQADQKSGGLGTQKIVGIALGGAGVVAGVVSVIFTANALGKKSDAKTYCNGSACTDQRGVSLLDDARSAGNVATITGIAGLALVGAGVVLFVTAPSASGGQVAFSPRYEPAGGSLVATGSF